MIKKVTIYSLEAPIFFLFFIEFIVKNNLLNFHFLEHMNRIQTE